MNTKNLKQRGRATMDKKYWFCVAVAFIMMFAGGSGSPISLNFNFSTGSGSVSGGSIEGFLNGFTSNFDSVFIIAIAVVAFLVAAAAIAVNILIFSSFRCGGIRFFMKLRKNQPVEIVEVFENLRDKTFLNIAKVTFFKALSILLWSLVFVIPGIIKTYEYWAVDYILAVRPDINKDEALSLSKTIMNGHKLDLFVLELSFIGWNIITSISFAIAGIFFVFPYKQATFVEFFSDVREIAIAEGKITPFDVPDYRDANPFTEEFNQYNALQYEGQYPQSQFGGFADIQNEPAVSQEVFNPSENNATDDSDIN